MKHTVTPTITSSLTILPARGLRSLQRGQP